MFIVFWKSIIGAKPQKPAKNNALKKFSEPGLEPAPIVCVGGVLPLRYVTPHVNCVTASLILEHASVSAQCRGGQKIF